MGINAYVDTDFAGGKATRRSTSGGVALYGSHTVKHWSTTQTSVCLSSGEAELRALVMDRHKLLVYNLLHVTWE